MFKFVLILALTSSANSAWADQIEPAAIIAAATGDWNGDGGSDLALLVAPPEPSNDVGIYLYLRDKNHALQRLVTMAPGKIWGNTRLDGMLGQDPSIEARPGGSIAVSSQNSAIGRSRWEQTLTIAYRDEQFVVAGYTYSYYDTLDTDDTGQCDYNILTGKVMAKGKASTVEPKTIAVGDWQDEVGQKACGFTE
ncbi:hypothetical protein [Rhizobium sp. AN80A]|uniref:hypothetical protein n=1 Tax=Rhizobium sp. AN80A TaxID=3040673 RepID=UPI0024B3543F|nr:hypothetical protein [Rhizobium sp. AN80A]